MQANIKPAPDGIDRRVLPGLHTVAMIEVVRGLPEVVNLITVLNWRIQGSKGVSSEEYREGNCDSQSGRFIRDESAILSLDRWI